MQGGELARSATSAGGTGRYVFLHGEGTKTRGCCGLLQLIIDAATQEMMSAGFRTATLQPIRLPDAFAPLKNAETFVGCR